MHDIMLILHLIGLAMGLGTSFGFMSLGIAASKLDKTEGQAFGFNILPLQRMGHIGLALLIITGGYLATPYWAVMGAMPYFMAKLVLVLVLIVLISILAVGSARAKKRNDFNALMKVSRVGRLALLVTLAIVVLAVLSFH